MKELIPTQGGGGFRKTMAFEQRPEENYQKHPTTS